MTEAAFKTAATEFVKTLLTPEELADPDTPDIIDFLIIVAADRYTGKVDDAKFFENLGGIVSQERMDALRNFVVSYEPKYKPPQPVPVAPAEGAMTINKPSGNQKKEVPEIYRSAPQDTEKKPEGADSNQPPVFKRKPQQHNNARREQPREDSSKQPKIFDRFKEDAQGQPMRKKVKVERQQQAQAANRPQKIVGEPTPNEQKQGGAQPPVDTGGKAKCKFFPFCKNEPCEFFHPTEKCAHFPRCRFGQACLYLHEPCKFKDTCTRANCFYDHPIKKRNTNPLMEMMKMIMTAQKKPMPAKRRPPVAQNAGVAAQSEAKQ